jgi:DNA-binding Lrp family transcriptional regulator
VDSKDFRLLVALYQNARQSFRSLGQRVSLSAPAVRDRLKRLESRGVLQGYWLYPDPSIFNRQDLMVFFRGDWKREDALNALEVEEVAFVTWKLDGALSVQVWPRDRKAALKNLSGVLGKPSGHTLTQDQRPRNVSAAGWRVMDALVDDPTMPFEVLTEKTGLSPKTVRKHLQLLVNDKTIFIMPRLGSLADSGEVIYHLAIQGNVALSDLRRSLGEVFVVSETDDPPMKYLLCRASDLADVTNKTRETKRLPGIKSVEVTLNRELFVATDFVHSLIRDMMSVTA